MYISVKSKGMPMLNNKRDNKITNFNWEHSRILKYKKNLSFVGKWMELEDILLIRLSQVQQGKGAVLLHVKAE